VNDQELRQWIDHWSAKYPADYDAVLKPLTGKVGFTHDDLEVIYEWKFSGLWPKSKVRLMREFPEQHVIALSGRAFACSDELGALVILTLIPGSGAAGASAILTAHSPERYTVMDVRAIRSLAMLERWQASLGTAASCLSWPDYLDTCRGIAARTDRPLRTVDHALWAAKGRRA
jgi:hypothetical protein